MRVVHKETQSGIVLGERVQTIKIAPMDIEEAKGFPPQSTCWLLLGSLLHHFLSILG
jgi:hypothetical protein